jgi:hypothetical protein
LEDLHVATSSKFLLYFCNHATERNWLIALNAFIMASGLLLGAFAIYLTALVSYNSISSDGQVRPTFNRCV